jgi:hypothetical protein
MARHEARRGLLVFGLNGVAAVRATAQWVAAQSNPA